MKVYKEIFKRAILSVVIISGSATIGFEIAKKLPEGFCSDYISGPLGIVLFGFLLYICSGMFKFRSLEK